MIGGTEGMLSGSTRTTGLVNQLTNLCDIKLFEPVHELLGRCGVVPLSGHVEHYLPDQPFCSFNQIRNRLGKSVLAESNELFLFPRPFAQIIRLKESNG